MANRRITVEPEQPDSLPNVSRRVLPLSVSPSERRKIEEGRQGESCKPTSGEPGSCNREKSNPDKSSDEPPAAGDQGDRRLSD